MRLPTAPSLVILILSFVLVAPTQSISIPLSNFHSAQFAVTFTYVKTVLFNAIPIIAVGIAVFLFYFFWSCCRCCNCCKLATNLSSKAKGFYIFGLIVVLAAGSAFVFFGFAANTEQAGLFDQIPVLYNQIASFVSDVSTRGTAVSTAVTDVNAKVSALLAADTHNCISSSDTNAITNAGSMLNSAASNVDSIANGVDFAKIKVTFDGAINQVKSLRNIIVLCVLSVLITIIFLQVVISLLNVFAKGNNKPSRNKCWKCITFFVTVFTVVLILLCFIVATVLFVSVSVFADFCDSPTNNILTATGLQSNNIAVYFLTCNLANPPANPFQSNINDVNSYFTTISNKLTNLQTQANAGGCNLNTQIADLITSVNSLHTAVGQDTNSDGVIDTGLLQEIECGKLNGIYLNIVGTSCTSLAPNLVSFFVVFVALASCMTIGEFFKKKLETRAVRSNKIVPMDGLDVEQQKQQQQQQQPPHYDNYPQQAQVDYGGYPQSTYPQSTYPQSTYPQDSYPQDANPSPAPQDAYPDPPPQGWASNV